MSGGAGTRIVETYTVSADGLTMERRMVIHDRLYTEPLVRMRGSARGENIELFEDPPCEPRDHIRLLYETDRLDQLWIE